MQLQYRRSCRPAARSADKHAIMPAVGRRAAFSSMPQQYRRGSVLLVRAGEDLEPDAYCVVVGGVDWSTCL